MTTVQSIRTAALGRRRELGLSQAQLAERVGVSRKWLSEFERGKATAELGLVLRVLESLGLQVTIGPTAEGQRADATGRVTNPPVDLDALLEDYRDGR
ncbi:MAG TPA: helix-turn-helix domain-containing protein [Nocardioidaceae bacterium]|nr:helix-turn-helix domain-containing protein [Nocardioidaceae bacterium]